MFLSLPDNAETAVLKEQILDEAALRFAQLQNEGKSLDEITAQILDEVFIKDEHIEKIYAHRARSNESQLTEKEAIRYLNRTNLSAKFLAFGTFFLILSGVFIVLLGQVFSRMDFSQIGTSGLGFTAIASVVCYAIGFTIRTSTRYSIKEKFISRPLEKAVRKRMELFHSAYLTYLFLGILFAAYSVIPMIYVQLFAGDTYYLQAERASTIIMIVILALSFYQIVFSRIKQTGYKYFLRNDYYSITDEQPQYIKGKSRTATIGNVVAVLATFFSTVALGYYVDWIGPSLIFVLFAVMTVLINQISRRY
jgi:hypothetical protein